MVSTAAIVPFSQAGFTRAIPTVFAPAVKANDWISPRTLQKAVPARIAAKKMILWFMVMVGS
jgi:hypothetical protein